MSLLHAQLVLNYELYVQEAVGRQMQWPGHNTDSKIAAHRPVICLLCYLLVRCTNTSSNYCSCLPALSCLHLHVCQIQLTFLSFMSVNDATNIYSVVTHPHHARSYTKLPFCCEDQPVLTLVALQDWHQAKQCSPTESVI